MYSRISKNQPLKIDDSGQRDSVLNMQIYNFLPSVTFFLFHYFVRPNFLITDSMLRSIANIIARTLINWSSYMK